MKRLAAGLVAIYAAWGCAQHPQADHASHTAQVASVSGSPELRAQIAAVRAATERYRDFENAKRDGYRLFGKEGPLMGEHWYRADLVKQPLDLTRPSTLQYATIDGRRELIGVAYTVYGRPGEPLPEGFAGSEDAWHVHDVDRIARVVTAERPFLRWLVDRRIAQGKSGAGDGRTHLTMLHAWIWLPNPDGVFALEHKALPYLRAGLPLELATAADAFAPYGVTLLDERGCAWELGKVKLLARPSRGQQRRLADACATAAAAVRQSEAAHLNHAASHAWREYLAVRDATLTAAQKQQLGAMLEQHGAHQH